MGTLVSGITKALSSSDERFLQLEEKRIKLDEMMLEMEEDRRKESDEREERRRRDEREFQLKLFTLMCNNAQVAPHPMMTPPYTTAMAQVVEVALLAVITCMIICEQK